MLEGIQILIDRMEMFPDEFRGGGNLNHYLYILDDPNGDVAIVAYYKSILTEEEIAAYKEATLKYHREALNRKVIEAVMEGEQKRESRLIRDLKQSMQNSKQTMANAITNNVFGNAPMQAEGQQVTISGAGGGGSGTYTTSTIKAPEILTGNPYDSAIGGGAFVTKTGALFTPAATTKKKK